MAPKQANAVQSVSKTKHSLASKPADADKIARDLRLRRALDTSRSELDIFMGSPQRHFRM